ncbi:MAG TPA: hypothetical protein V6C84_07365 [Coleofasciculaceae cyanobacterium]
MKRNLPVGWGSANAASNRSKSRANLPLVINASHDCCRIAIDSVSSAAP